jgi:hypothetical protein
MKTLLLTVEWRISVAYMICTRRELKCTAKQGKTIETTIFTFGGS